MTGWFLARFLKDARAIGNDGSKDGFIIDLSVFFDVYCTCVLIQDAVDIGSSAGTEVVG